MKVFHSKVSYLLVLIFIVAMLSPLILFLLNSSNSKSEISPFYLLMFGLWALILYLLFDTKYIINKNVLSIKIGFIPYGKLAITSITKIEKTKSILSAPASSLDRIIIHYDTHGAVIVSPKSKLEFVEALKTINPSIISKI